MLDCYSWGTVERISPEAPIPVLRLLREEYRLGGAGNVVKNLLTLDCKVSVAGLVGEDVHGDRILNLLTEEGVSIEGVQREPDYPSVLKHRMIAGHTHLLRLDHDPPKNYQWTNTTHLLYWLKEELPHHEALVVSDYHKGALSAEVLQQVIAWANDLQIPVVVDPRNDGDYGIYRGCDLIKPNRKEASLASGIEVDTVKGALKAAQHLQDKFGVGTVALSLDKDGLLLFQNKENFRLFEAEALEVFDVVGAGDMVVSVLGMLLAEKVPVEIAAYWAQLAAAMEIQHVGVVSFERSEIRQRFVFGHSSAKIVTPHRLLQQLRTQPQHPLVLTNGYFDQLSSGHLKFLSQLRQLKGFNVVAINSDASILRQKGHPPLLDEWERARLLATLDAVDRVIIFDEDDCSELLRRLRPHIVVKGERYQTRELREASVLAEIGARLEFFPEYALGHGNP